VQIQCFCVSFKTQTKKISIFSVLVRALLVPLLVARVKWENMMEMSHPHPKRKMIHD
jgi:hypothetical protein